MSGLRCHDCHRLVQAVTVVAPEREGIIEVCWDCFDIREAKWARATGSTPRPFIPSITTIPPQYPAPYTPTEPSPARLRGDRHGGPP